MQLGIAVTVESAFFAPPSVLPDISPTRGKIGSFCLDVSLAASAIGETKTASRSPPSWGRCPAGQRGARESTGIKNTTKGAGRRQLARGRRFPITPP